MGGRACKRSALGGRVGHILLQLVVLVAAPCIIISRCNASEGSVCAEVGGEYCQDRIYSQCGNRGVAAHPYKYPVGGMLYRRLGLLDSETPRDWVPRTHADL